MCGYTGAVVEDQKMFTPPTEPLAFLNDVGFWDTKLHSTF